MKLTEVNVTKLTESSSLDVEGASDKTSFESMDDATSDHGVWWIDFSSDYAVFLSISKELECI
jgi:hypothetical protein